MGPQRPDPAIEPPPDLPSGHVISAEEALEFRTLIKELASRQIEALKLYEPLPMQEAFHASGASERLARGSNRAGKTLVVAVEVARAVTGQDPYKKFPLNDGRFFCVGKDGKHIGQVMWRKLGRPGAFRIIRDRLTGQWRAYRPWVEDDVARKAETRPAPPLIPRRLIADISWEVKKESQPNTVHLVNGWELSFFSSLGKPPQGSDIDGAWFDEEIWDPDWYPEMSARLIDRSGKFIWSATPQAGTEHLYDLSQRCEDQVGLEKPKAVEFLMLMRDNPHFGEEQKQNFIDKLSSPEEIAVRVGGEFAVNSYKVYPEFNSDRHMVDLKEVPRNWTRYMVVDPGHQICAVLFAAVPPIHEGRKVYLYDELYIRDADARQFGKKVAAKAVGQTFWAFLADDHGMRMTQIAAGKTAGEQYTEALRANNVSSLRTGFGFLPGSDDVQGGLEAVRGMLRPDEFGNVRLQVVKGMLPNFEFEIRRYHHKRERNMVTDKPDQRKHNHLMDCLRYLANYDPQYHEIKAGKAAPTGAYAAYLAIEERKRRNNSEGGYIHLGPGRRDAS